MMITENEWKEIQDLIAEKMKTGDVFLRKMGGKVVEVSGTRIVTTEGIWDWPYSFVETSSKQWFLSCIDEE